MSGKIQEKKTILAKIRLQFYVKCSSFCFFKLIQFPNIRPLVEAEVPLIDSHLIIGQEQFNMV